MLAVRRVRAHSALFTALLGVCLLLAGLGTGLIGYLDGQSRQAVRAGIAALEGSARELRYDAPKSDDPAAQSRRARALIERELVRAGGAGMPVRVTTSDGSNGEDTVWTIVPITSAVEPSDLAALAVVGDRIEKALLDSPDVAAQGVERSGTLDQHAAALRVAIAPLAAVEPVPLLLVAAIGLVTLAELGRLLDRVRVRETSLLRSRGASAARVALTTAAEAATVAAVGVAVGAGGALAVLAAIGSPPVQPALAVAVALAVEAAAVVLVTAIALASARRTFRRGTADETGRARRLAAPALLVLLVVAAGLSLWRFLQFGSPLSPTEAGAEVDPLAVLAPALCLAVVALAGLAALPVAAGGLERLATRRDGVRAALVSREVARRVRTIASPFVVVALAGGGLVLAAGYQPTWGMASTATAELHAGADLVVTGTTDVARVAAVEGVRAVAPVFTATGDLQDQSTVHLTAIPAAGLAAAGTSAGGSIDTVRLSKELAARLPVVALPAGATALTATVTWTGAAPALSAWLLEDDGRATEITFSPAGASPAVITATIPAGAGARSLVGVDAQLSPAGGAAFGTVGVAGALTGFSAATPAGTTDLMPTEAWSLASGTTVNGQVAPSGVIGYAGQVFSTTDIRMQPATATPTPVVLSRAFARAISAAPGDTPDLDVGIVPGSFPATIADVVDQVPGSPGSRGMLVDLSALQVATLRAGGAPVSVGQLWAASPDAAATAPRIRATVAGSHVTGPGLDPSARVLGAVPRALWAGMLGGAVLALVALGAVAGELLRMRADEVGVLRAIGMPAATVAGMRRAELALVVASALVVALVGGLLTGILTIPGLARAAILDPFPGSPVPLRFDLIALGAALVAMIAAVAAVLTVYGARVRRQALALATPEGER